jgi:hypothetical protein
MVLSMPGPWQAEDSLTDDVAQCLVGATGDPHAGMPSTNRFHA